MGEGYHFLDIILLAMIAGFIILRLRSVLGRRTGHEAPPQPSPLARNTDLPDRKADNVVPLPDRKSPDLAPPAAPTGPAAAGIGRVMAADPTFDQAQFLEGAKAAYEMIVTAFAKGEKDVLKPLLAKEVFDGFAESIDHRIAAGHEQEAALVGLKSVEIVRAEVTNHWAEVTVKFAAEMINSTRDSTGKIIGGNPNAVEDVTDLWTFSRDTRSDDPNWLLSATSAAD